MLQFETLNIVKFLAIYIPEIGNCHIWIFQWPLIWSRLIVRLWICLVKSFSPDILSLPHLDIPSTSNLVSVHGATEFVSWIHFECFFSWKFWPCHIWIFRRPRHMLRVLTFPPPIVAAFHNIWKARFACIKTCNKSSWIQMFKLFDALNLLFKKAPSARLKSLTQFINIKNCPKGFGLMVPIRGNG